MRTVHEYFGLSYASHQVIPRVLAASMPEGWQRRFVGLMEELDAAFPDTGPEGYDVRPARWRYPDDLAPDELQAAGVTAEWAGDSRIYRDREGVELLGQVPVPTSDPLPHYRNGHVEPDLDAIEALRTRRRIGDAL
jgi:hypothetical protein